MDFEMKNRIGFEKPSFVRLSESKRKHLTFFRKLPTNFICYFIHLICC